MKYNSTNQDRRLFYKIVLLTRVIQVNQIPRNDNFHNFDMFYNLIRRKIFHRPDFCTPIMEETSYVRFL